MRIQELRKHSLLESMSFNPVALGKTERHPEGIWSSVIDKYTTPYDTERIDWERFYKDEDYEEPANPHYKPDLDLNLSNANMRYIMNEVLGMDEYYDPDLDGYHIPIDDFLARAQKWLTGRGGQTTPEVDPYEEPRKFKRTVSPDPETGIPTISGGYEGARMIHGGRREGYDEEVILKMIRIADFGKRMGATHVTAH